jgi:hypothetical protein
MKPANLFKTVMLGAIMLTGCEKESDDNSVVIIRTDKSEYVVNSKMGISLKNNSEMILKHFKCDNYAIRPLKLIEKVDGNWVAEDFQTVCTQMGPVGYNGTLNVNETKNDTVNLLNTVGTYKLRYRFITETDTFDIDSNEFLLFGLEL